MMIPMSAFEPPWCVMKRGKRKKLLKLDMVNRFAMPIMINEGPYRFEAVLELNLESDLPSRLPIPFTLYKRIIQVLKGKLCEAKPKAFLRPYLFL